MPYLLAKLYNEIVYNLAKPYEKAFSLYSSFLYPVYSPSHFPQLSCIFNVETTLLISTSGKQHISNVVSTSKHNVETMSDFNVETMSNFNVDSF